MINNKIINNLLTNLSLIKYTIRLTLQRFNKTHNIYIILYDIVILILYGAFIISLVTLLLGYIVIPLLNDINIYKLNIILQYIPSSLKTSIFNTMTSISFKGEIIPRSDLIAIMATSLSVVAGFYGVISQLYTGEWGGTILVRRLVLLVKRTAYKCPDDSRKKQIGAYDNPLSWPLYKDIEFARRVFFPSRSSLMTVTFDQVIVTLIITAFIIFMGIVLIGSTHAIPSSSIISIFILILSASVILLILSVIVKPPLVVYLGHLSKRGSILSTRKMYDCMPVNLGIHSWFRHPTMLFISTISFFIIGLLLYFTNPVCIPCTDPLWLIVGYTVFATTTLSLLVITGTINIDIFQRVYYNIGYMINNIVRIYRSLRKAPDYIQISLIILFISLLVFLYVRFPMLLGLLLIIIISIIISYGTYMIMVRGEAELDFRFLVDYTNKVLSGIRTAGLPPYPHPSVVLLELLAAETILAYMLLVAAYYKSVPIGYSTISRKDITIIRSNDEMMGVQGLRLGLTNREDEHIKDTLSSLQLVYDERDVATRFYAPMADVEEYFIHVENLASIILEWLEHEPWLVDKEVVYLLLMASVGLLEAYNMGRIRSPTYPQAVLNTALALLHIKQAKRSLDERTREDIDNILPGILALLAELAYTFPTAICNDETIDSIISYTGWSRTPDEEETRCLIAGMILAPCTEDKMSRKTIEKIVSKDEKLLGCLGVTGNFDRNDSI